MKRIRIVIVFMLAVLLTIAMSVPVFAASNSQVVADPNTIVWQDGFGFHCNAAGGNGATDVKYLGDNAAITKSIANIKKQPAGSLVVAKGDQKDIFGTKTFPITLERVGDTTAWNLMTVEVKCETCGRTDWVTYSNNSGKISGKNIQAHHPPLPPPPPPPVDPKGSLSFSKQVEGEDVATWLAELFKLDMEDLDSFAMLAALLAGLEFHLDGPNGNYVASPNISGEVFFGNVVPGTYTLSEIVVAPLIGLFKEFEPIENIVIGEGHLNFTVIGGTLRGNIDGVSINEGDLFTIYNGFGKNGYVSGVNGLGYTSGDLTSNGDLFYISVTNTSEPYTEFPSFCANAGSHTFHEGYGAYMVGHSMNDVRFLQAFNYIVDNYYGEEFGDFGDTGTAQQSFARRVAQSVLWVLLGAIDVESTFWNGVLLSDDEKAAVEATLANYEGYVGGSVIDVVYMQCEEHGVTDYGLQNCQPQIVPIFGTFYVENEPNTVTTKGSVSFNKTLYGGLMPLWESNGFSFDLFKIVNGEEEYFDTYDVGLITGTVYAGELQPGKYVFREQPWATYHPESIPMWAYVWYAIYPGGQTNSDGLYFEITPEYKTVWETNELDGAGNPTVDNRLWSKHYMHWANEISEHQDYLNLGEGKGFIKFLSDIGATIDPVYSAATCTENETLWFKPSTPDDYDGFYLVTGPPLGHVDKYQLGANRGMVWVGCSVCGIWYGSGAQYLPEKWCELSGIPYDPEDW